MDSSIDELPARRNAGRSAVRHGKLPFMATALVIFLVTYLFIGLRQIPRIHIDRPAGALVGAVLMVVAGVLTLDEAFAAVDLHTLLLLLGMMIITVYLRAAGFFELMADRILSLSKTPLQLLILVSVSSGILSALFVNDTICLLYTPIILAVAAQLGVHPMPYLLALATSSNIGSVMTVTGNPQNMLIGIYSRVPYLSFLGALFPVAVIGLCVSIAVIRFVYRTDFGKGLFDRRPDMPPYEVDRRLLAKSMAVSAGVLAAFALGAPYSLTAAAGAVVLMLIGGIRTERVLEGVDWTLLLFFAGLFVVMHGVEVSGLAGEMIGGAGDLSAASPAGRIAGLSLISAILSNLVSNVPAVMLLKPFIESLGGDRVAWFALAMSSTLAGNLTLIGSVANLIVAQQARKQVEIGFLEYLRVGALITVITIAAGILVLVVEVKTARGAEWGAAVPPKLDTIVTVTPGSTGRPARVFRVVLLCDTAEKQRQGLQGFRQLAPDEAALFPYPTPAEPTFWMGSVTFPIDIIFVAPDRTVRRVQRDCRPHQRDLYPSGGPVRWVIETAAGSGIRAGDRVDVTGPGAGGRQ
jgi:Na+/H+ antiporter NhaD/arsenite permease-like protein/uncharacterized membrane protein (UPF0127 family)